MRTVPRVLAVGVIALALGGCSGEDRGGAGRLRVYAAASLVDLVGELADTFEAREGAAVELNLAGTNTLAQQILAAPGADVFLSADLHWIRVLEEAGRLTEGSRRALLGNRLVLVANHGSDLRLRRPADLAGAPFAHLALADPEGVPAGRYARAALEAIEIDGGTLWAAVAPRVAPALDVRAALALVESDPAILGVVYMTDALRSPRVRVVHELSSAGGAGVTYYGALVAGGRRPDVGRRFLDLVAGPEGQRIAERHGFEALPG